MKYVVLAVVLVLLAGCGGDPQPKFSTSAPTAPTVSPTTTAPAVETPQAFLRRWVRAMDAMERTGEPEPWEALNLKSCKDCATVAATVRGVYAQGFHVVGSHSRVLSVSRSGDGQWHVDLKLRPTGIFDAHDRRRGGYPGGEVRAEVRVVRVDGRLRVAAYFREGM